MWNALFGDEAVTHLLGLFHTLAFIFYVVAQSRMAAEAERLEQSPPFNCVEQLLPIIAFISMLGLGLPSVRRR